VSSPLIRGAARVHGVEENMRNYRYRMVLLVGLLSFTVCAFAANGGTRLAGRTGASPTWKSGWLDLAAPTDFKQGETLKLTIGGTAKRVVVRLLVKGGDHDAPEGVVATGIAVPDNRILKLVLPSDFLQTVQISVHGGPNPFNQFPLGSGNGAATLVSVERFKAVK
jgi:hypothetical protein